MRPRRRGRGQLEAAGLGVAQRFPSGAWLSARERRQSDAQGGSPDVQSMMVQRDV